MIKVRQKLGKYRIDRKLGEGGFAVVYEATDLIEGVSVALKIPHTGSNGPDVVDDLRKEVRLAARLRHPNILPLKNADIIDGHFVIAFPLGEQTLADRLMRRTSAATAISYSEQLLSALSYAHEQRVIHCDVKPENLIIFPEQRLMLTDFGLAKIAVRTIRASGAGTVGYMAPEQAMGRPSFRSDVFSAGLIMYRMFSGHLPEWPLQWPPPGYEKMRGRIHSELIQLIRRAIEIDPRKRFRDGRQMLQSLTRIKQRNKQRKKQGVMRSTSRGSVTNMTSSGHRHWETVRRRQFQKQFGRVLRTVFSCHRCDGPVSEPMFAVPGVGRIARCSEMKHHFHWPVRDAIAV